MQYDLTTKLQEENLKYFDPAKPPFSLHGVLAPDENEDCYRRMPAEVARETSRDVAALYTNTAGGRVRFVTDSPYVALKAFLPKVTHMNHMAQTGIAGFSVYGREDGGREMHYGTVPPNDEGIFEGIVRFPTKKMQEITVYMPLYNDVSRFYIGIDGTAKLEKALPYAIEKPVVFYGSSITQGGCASKPGSDYEACLSRTLGFDYLCLGFSGSAKGETAMARYIAALEMSAFVMDYDHNAPTPEHLQKTHMSFFKIIRKAHPDLPILLLSRPHPLRDADNRRRFEIIRSTWENAKACGDKNVYLIDGADFFTDAPFNDPTVDNCHPTDYGFYLMAKGIEPTLRVCLKNRQ